MIQPKDFDILVTKTFVNRNIFYLFEPEIFKVVIRLMLTIPFNRVGSHSIIFITPPSAVFDWSLIEVLVRHSLINLIVNI